MSEGVPPPKKDTCERFFRICLKMFVVHIGQQGIAPLLRVGRFADMAVENRNRGIWRCKKASGYRARGPKERLPILNCRSAFRIFMNGPTKRKAPIYGSVALLCAMAAGFAASGSSTPAAANSGSVRHDVERGSADTHLAARILRTHNDERRRLALRPLKWNVHLEREAREWAHHLSRRGMLQHASQQGRNRTGENLWMGTSGHWPVENMVGMFIEEKKHYRHARFPDISQYRELGGCRPLHTGGVARHAGGRLRGRHRARGMTCWSAVTGPAGNVWGPESVLRPSRTVRRQAWRRHRRDGLSRAFPKDRFRRRSADGPAARTPGRNRNPFPRGAAK